MTRDKVAISGFMIVKNVVRQGYPFLEAITAALPICDEFLVSEGYSSDETWEALQILKEKYPDKIKLFRDEWKGQKGNGGIFAKMTNILKQKCTGSYCLNVQANEVLHESSLEEIRNLPLLYPDVEMFRLPFYNIMGSRLLWVVDFRRRLFKNKKHIVSRGDAFDVGYDPSQLLFYPRKLVNYVLYSKGELTYYLPQPFYRYRALFPMNYLKKLESRSDFYKDINQSHLWNKEYINAKNLYEITLADRSPEAFWQEIRIYFDKLMWQDLPQGVRPETVIPRECIKELTENPEIMNHLIDKWEYNLQDSLNMLNAN